MIVIDKVVKSFGSEKVLDNICLEVSKGEIFGIVGLSGAGKSTLLRCINLLEKPDSGCVMVDGVEVTVLDGSGLVKARQEIGMIFQGFNLFTRRSIRENVAFPLRVAGVSRAKAEARVAELLDLVGLTDKIDAYPRELSGGQQQRVAIARALANNPHVLLCDEPTSALDLITAKTILELLLNINRKLGLTIVLITHQIHVIRAVCHRAAVIHQGKVAEVGSVAQIVSRPTSAIARSLLRSEVPLELAAPGSWCLSFVGNSAEKPILAELIRETGVMINILAGNIEQGQSSFGWLLVEVEGTPNQQDMIRKRLETSGVLVEVM